MLHDVLVVYIMRVASPIHSSRIATWLSAYLAVVFHPAWEEVVVGGG